MKKSLLFFFAMVMVISCSSPDVQENVEEESSASILDRLEADYFKREYMIPMRDGMSLYTCAYLPKDSSKTYPILMQRTPYSCAPYGEMKMGERIRNKYLLDDGYIFVFQDVRGRWSSEGDFDNMRPFLTDTGAGGIDESTDTYDTVDWLLRNISFDNGNVGVYGISYPGFYAAAASVRAHPAVKAVSPQAPIGDFYFDDFHHRGAYTLGYFAVTPVFGYQTEPTTERWYTSKMMDTDQQDPYQFYLDIGPLKNLNAHTDEDNFFWNQLKEHPDYDAFWSTRSILPHLENNHVAVMTVGGLFDAEDLYGPFQIYKTLEGLKGPKGQNTLVMGPWSHGDWSRDREDQIVGDLHFGSGLSDGFKRTMEAPFFRKHLHESVDFVAPEALVYNTGALQWDTLNQWPAPNTKPKSYFLNSAGSLASETATTNSKTTFVSDPSKPVPYREKTEWRFTPRPYMTEDQRHAGRRPDVLVFETEVLDESVTLTGDIMAELFVSTNQTDADWVVKLIDVFPGDTTAPEKVSDEVALGNYWMMVRSEILRGRYRNSFSSPEPFISNKVTQVNIPLQAVNHTFKKGHRIMIQVQSTWFPLFDRNPQKYVPNIFEANENDFVAATHSIYSGENQASRVVVRQR